MPLFAQMQCAKCEHEVWIEAHGQRPWSGDCPKCKTNAWTWLGWTDDHMAAIRQTAKSLGVELFAVHKVAVPARCKARDLDDPESYRCEYLEGHKGPHFNDDAEPDTEDNPWERGVDPQRFSNQVASESKKPGRGPESGGSLPGGVE